MKCEFCGARCRDNAYQPYCGYRCFSAMQDLEFLEKMNDVMLIPIWGKTDLLKKTWYKWDKNESDL